MRAEGFYGEVTLPTGSLEHAALLLLPVHGLLRVQQPPGGHPDQGIHLQVRGMGGRREHGIDVCHWGGRFTSFCTCSGSLIYFPAVPGLADMDFG